MARLPSRLPRGSRWAALFQASVWVLNQGQQAWERLSAKERSQLAELARKSKGRPGNLTAKERSDFRRIVVKAVGREPK